MYDFIPNERQDLQEKLVEAYLERHPDSIKLSRDIRLVMGSDRKEALYKFSKHLIEKATPDKQIMLTHLKKLTEGELTESEYENEYSNEYEKISNYFKWRDYFSKKGKLDLVKGLELVTFETALIDIPQEGLELELGNPEGPKERLTKGKIEKTYRIRKTPVTLGQYLAYLEDTQKYGQQLIELPRVSTNFPVQLSIKELQSYIVWENGITGKKSRIPTEAEWEYAASGGSRENFTDRNNRDEFLEHAWHRPFNNDNFDSYYLVALKLPNVFGLYDMIANTQELTTSESGYILRGNYADSIIQEINVYNRNSLVSVSKIFGIRLVEEVP